MQLAEKEKLFKIWCQSRELFPSLADRLPSPENPAYADYCRQWNIDENEKDIFVLLTTIGRRGPSTFVFEAASQSTYGGEDIKAFRNRLELTQTEFESLVGMSHATLVKLETSRSKNDFYLRQLQLIDEVPQALKWLLQNRGQGLHDQKRLKLLDKVSIPTK